MMGSTGRAIKGPDVRIIAAVGRRGQIGMKGFLPWNDPADLAWFKNLTTQGGIIICGPRTFDALPKLSNRIVLKDNFALAPHDFLAGNCLTSPDGQVVWIAGGEATYKRWLASGLVGRCIISTLNHDGPADRWMPQLWHDRRMFDLISLIAPKPDEFDHSDAYKVRMYDALRERLYPKEMP